MTKNEVIETIRTWMQTIDDEYDIEEQGRVYGLMEALELVKQIEPEQKWIPVSERLPEVHQDVILSLRSLDVVVGFKAETEPYFYHYGYIDPQNVLAWMPVPTPYVLQEGEVSDADSD